MWVMQYILATTFQCDFAILKDVCAVGNLQCLVHILLDQQDGHSILMDPFQKLKYFIDHDRCKAQRWLIKH